MVRIVKKPEVRRREILDAARELFKSKGYANATIQDVMSSLKIAKGTVYHYFQSKEELLEAVVREIVDENFAEMTMALESAHGDALAKFKLLIEKGNISVENQDLLEQLHHPNNQAMHCRILAEMIAKQARLYAKVIEQGNKEKLFNAKKPLESAELFLSGMQFLTDVGFYPWSAKELSRRVKSFPKILEQMLGAPSGCFKSLFNAF